MVCIYVIRLDQVDDTRGNVVPTWYCTVPYFTPYSGPQRFNVMVGRPLGLADLARLLVARLAIQQHF